MHEPTTYEIVVRGRASDRLLRSLLDDFAVDHPEPGSTRLTGLVRDPAHLHGVLAHLTSVAIEIDRVTALERPGPRATSQPPRTHRSAGEAMTANTNRRPQEPGTPRPAPSTAAPPSRAGGIGALVATATFLFGIGLFVTQLADYTATDASPASSVAFLVDHQATLFIWNVVIYLVFGAALVPLVGALRQRLRVHRPELADTAAVFGYVWVGLMFATGMVATIGIGAVADLAGDATQAQALWSAVDTVTNGLGGGNEIVGGAWILLVSIAGLRASVLPRGLHVLGGVTALAGIVTLVPALEEVGMVFGLGCIAWFAWVGVELLRRSAKRGARQHTGRNDALDAHGVGVDPA